MKTKLILLLIFFLTKEISVTGQINQAMLNPVQLNETGIISHLILVKQTSEYRTKLFLKTWSDSINYINEEIDTLTKKIIKTECKVCKECDDSKECEECKKCKESPNCNVPEICVECEKFKKCTDCKECKKSNERDSLLIINLKQQKNSIKKSIDSISSAYTRIQIAYDRVILQLDYIIQSRNRVLFIKRLNRNIRKSDANGTFKIRGTSQMQLFLKNLNICYMEYKNLNGMLNKNDVRLREKGLLSNLKLTDILATTEQIVGIANSIDEMNGRRVDDVSKLLQSCRFKSVAELLTPEKKDEKKDDDDKKD
jgi:hypothetical protein